MSHQREFFETCLACLNAPDVVQGYNYPAAKFLQALGYRPTSDVAGDFPDPVQNENRCALLKLASRFADTFHLAMPYAPGAAFFGAQVSPAAHGITGHGASAVGAGGRGRTLREAFESCVGEAAEYLSFLERDDDPMIRPIGDGHGLMPDEFSWVLAGIGLDRDDTVPDWVEAYALSDGRSALFPSELVLRRPTARRQGSRIAESNGVGAGVTLEQAIYTGLMEVVERDAVALWWFGGRAARALNPQVERSSGFQQFVRTVRGDSERDVWFIDLTTDLNVPSIAALSSAENGLAVIAGFAADLDPEHAARRALLEMCQMELAQQISIHKWRTMGESTLKDMDKVWVKRFKTLNTENHPRLRMAEKANEAVSLQADLAVGDIAKHMERAGFAPYAIDLTRPEIGIPVARVIVPGLQSAKPDWTSKRLFNAARANAIDMTDLLRASSPI